MVDEFPQAQVLCKGGRQEQAGIGHQAVVVKDDADTVGIILWQHLLNLSHKGLLVVMGSTALVGRIRWRAGLACHGSPCVGRMAVWRSWHPQIRAEVAVQEVRP